MDLGSDGGKLIFSLGILMLLVSVALCNPVPSKSSTKKPKSAVNAGHVCIETSTETSLENVTVIYPCLKNYTVKCGWLWTRNCTRLRQSNCSKTELQLVPRNVTNYVCCTGWTRDDQFRCLVPLCKDGCLNGGTCVDKTGGPVCECPAGYAGVRCQDNLDECLSPDPPCDQICVNTVTSYKCKCLNGYVLEADNASCNKLNETSETPVSGLWTSNGKKRAIGSTAVYIMIAIGAVLLLLLITSTFYLLVRRKERLAMETILKDRINLSVNDYSNPAFRRFSNEFVLTDRYPQDQSMVYSTGNLSENNVGTINQNTPNFTPNGVVLQPPTLSYTSEQSIRNSTASNESLNSNGSTGWTNPMLMSATVLENVRPSTYAVIEEECYSGSNPSGIYTSIPESVQTLEGFHPGESNDYDSFSSSEFEQEAIYENGFVPNPHLPVEIKSIYLHPPNLSVGSLSIPIQEENNYEYVSDDCNKLQQISEFEYDYVANDDEMFSNRESSASSQFGCKQTGDEALYEDTDSPNITLDSTVEDVNYDQCEETPNSTLSYHYDYATDPQNDEYYEDCMSVKTRQSDFQDEYDYVSNSDLAGYNENRESSETTHRRHSSVDEEFTGPTTYYDDTVFLARSGYLDDCPDPVGELPEYEYVRNSDITVTSTGTERNSNLSDVTLGRMDESSRNSVVSYASINGSDCELSTDEHDYDEITKRNPEDCKDQTEIDCDSDYEHVADVLEPKIQELNGAIEEGFNDVRPPNGDVTFLGSNENIPIIATDYEPVYDDVCPLEPTADGGQEI